MDINKILITSEKMFFAKRYEEIKLDNIANELKIKKPSLYYYFKSKKELFIETLKLSKKNYIKELDKIIAKNDLDIFVRWYLTYPALNKNLFGIAYQKEYCLDENIQYIIQRGKEEIMFKIEGFLDKYGLSKQQSYLIILLLEKLAQINCIKGYCLPIDLDTLTNEIINIIKNI